MTTPTPLVTPTPLAGKPRAKWAKLKAKLNLTSPSAMIALGAVGVLVVGALLIMAGKQLRGGTVVYNALGQQEQATPTTTPAPIVLPANPLSTAPMPRLSPEALRMIGRDARDINQPDWDLSRAIFERMSPPYQPPGVDLCAYRLAVNASTGQPEPTLDQNRGVWLFDHINPPGKDGRITCAIVAPASTPAEGRLPAAATTGAAQPTTTSTLPTK